MPITGRIAYVHNAGEPDDVTANDIWVIDAGGGEPAPLITDPESEFTPFWLLDGSRLVFAVFDFRTAAGPYHGRLVSALPDGSGRKDLAPVSEYNAVLSPDGRYVAWGGAGTDGITLLDRSTGEAKLLTKDGATDPIWSPDSKALLVREPTLDAVAVVEVPSGRLTRFRKPDIERVVGWTKDGASIVFGTGSSDGNISKWIAPAAGGSVVAVQLDFDLADPETWSSPDGQWTVDGALEARPANGGRPVELAAGLRMHSGSPSWSVDGNALAFAGRTLDEDYSESAIYVVGLDGRTPARITAGPYDSSPAWQPNR